MTQEIIAAGLIFILSYYTHIIHAQCELLIVYNCNVPICDGQNHYVQVRRVNNFEVLYWRCWKLDTYCNPLSLTLTSGEVIFLVNLNDVHLSTFHEKLILFN